MKKEPDVEISLHPYFLKKDCYRVKSKPGIYVYYYRTKCIYVGKANSLRYRALRIMHGLDYTDCKILKAIVDNVNKNHLNIHIYYYPIEKISLREYQYIQKLKPVANYFPKKYELKK